MAGRDDEADTPDTDSDGVYYVPIDVFEWRPSRPEPTGSDPAAPEVSEDSEADADPQAEPD